LAIAHCCWENFRKAAGHPLLDGTIVFNPFGTVVSNNLWVLFVFSPVICKHPNIIPL
jgi:hypothetical protein